MKNIYKKAFDLFEKMDPKDFKALTELTIKAVDRGMPIQKYKKEAKHLLTVIENRRNLKQKTLAIARKAMRS